MSDAKLSTGLDGWRRSHNLGELTAANHGQTVTLMGWVHRRRDHGGLIFLDLRDRFGITQVVLDPAISAAAHKTGEDLRSEYVVALKGDVKKRPDGMMNEGMATGAVEIYVRELKILNKSEVLPFSISDKTDASETLRLKHRYLDMRRPQLRDSLIGRIHFVRAMRKALDAHGFLDIETPYLYKSTPEGAREFLVPSRLHPGQFYALPQSPQLFKQVLMIGGFDRYYQVVKCFRDEDSRSDRQPEFTQIDCELSFVEEESIQEIFEKVISTAVKEFLGVTIPTPFPRMTFDRAMEEYGVDKPDTRFELRLNNLTDLVQNSGFKVFAEAVSMGGIVNAIVLPAIGDGMSRKDLDDLGEIAKTLGAKGLAWVKKKAGSGQASWQSPIAKFFDDKQIAAMDERMNLKEGDLALFGAGPYDGTKAMLGALRNHLGAKLGLTDPKKFNFLWVTEFPLLEKDADSGRWLARHHPFTMPRSEDLHLMESDPAKVRACAYDMVLNGYEIAGGSIRIHDPDVQQRLFDRIGLTRAEAESKFGFLMEALKFGAPPHGGMAFGLDRVVMLLLGLDAIRDVIPFPKTQKATDLMTGAPSSVTIEQLRDLHIRVQPLAT